MQGSSRLLLQVLLVSSVALLAASAAPAAGDSDAAQLSRLRSQLRQKRSGAMDKMVYRR